MKALTTGTTGTGVDLVVIGMPYSDPMMDGTVIQHVTTWALERGVRTRDTLLAAEAVAGTGTPCMIMTYWNLVERYGVDAYARDLASAGGSGLITPDLTPDEAEDRGHSVTVGIDRMCAIVDDLAAGVRRAERQ
jgi:tryptophan synthase alpha chain